MEVTGIRIGTRKRTIRVALTKKEMEMMPTTKNHCLKMSCCFLSFLRNSVHFLLAIIYVLLINIRVPPKPRPQFTVLQEKMDGKPNGFSAFRVTEPLEMI
jgi:hypothetical protein